MSLQYSAKVSGCSSSTPRADSNVKPLIHRNRITVTEERYDDDMMMHACMHQQRDQRDVLRQDR